MANSLTEFDEEEFIRDIHQEGYDEGFSNAISQGIFQGTLQKAVEAARKLVAMNVLTHEQIAEAEGLPLEKVKELAQEKCRMGD